MLSSLCLFIVAACELSPKVDTTNIIKKIGIGFILIGSFISLADKPNELHEIGIFIYFSANILSAYFTKRTRRKNDVKSKLHIPRRQDRRAT